MTVLKVAAATLVLLFATIAAHAQVGHNEKILNPNVAAEDQIAGVPHVGATLAKAIVSQRPFTDTLQLDALLRQTLNETQRREVYAQLFIPINLNTASNDEMMLIPGLTPRMAHEFDEYRPYTSLVQFRREIGKYVDQNEVARLEQFVFVPLDLNSATREDFAGIPGVSDRMVREFLEYRPYQSMEQFRREIGKYVDDKELARLERYMTIR